MLSAIWTLVATCRRFGSDHRGAAAVEFALIMPVLITLYLGSLEISALLTTDRKVTVVAGTVGDLAARANKTLYTSTLDDYFAAAAMIMSPQSTTGLRQVVTEVSVDANGNASVVWSRKYGTGASAYTVGASYTLDKTSEINKLARGGYLVISEVAYSYTPLLGLFFSHAFALSSTNYYLPRFSSNITLTTG